LYLNAAIDEGFRLPLEAVTKPCQIIKTTYLWIQINVFSRHLTAIKNIHPPNSGEGESEIYKDSR
jgi:hypothetical protein